MEAAVWGFIGTVVGALASLGATLLSTRNTASMQASASSLERAETARAFQRNKLLELQDALHDSMRLVARGHREDEAAFRATVSCGKHALSEEVNESERLARRRTLILIERIADDALRTDLKNLNESLIHVFIADSKAGADAQYRDAAL